MKRFHVKSKELGSQGKAVLTILISEIQSCSTMSDVQKLINSWIDANDLHPEQVQTYSAEEAKKLFGIKPRRHCD